MKKVQKTLTAALAATLATGIVGSVANAAPVDELYAAAYNATGNAEAKKDQASINEARAAIAKLPAEYKSHIGNLSGRLDKVQQPIYVNILSALEKAQKENNQANINAARKMLVGVEQNYANTWSAELDKSQQALIKKAQDACEKATKSGDAKDIKEAQALLADIKTVEGNEAVKTFAEKFETEFTTGLTMTALSATVVNSETIKVEFNRAVDADTAVKENFVLATKAGVKAYAKDVVLSEDKKVATVTVGKMDENKDYTLTVKAVKDEKGTEVKSSSFDVKFEKKEATKVEFVRAKALRGEELKKLVKATDAAGNDITKDVKITFTSTEKNLVTKDGKISSSAKLNKEFTITATIGDVTAEEKVTIVDKLAEEIVAFTIGDAQLDEDTKLEDITPNNRIKADSTSKFITLFIKNADGKVVKIDGSDATLKSSDEKIVRVSGGKIKGIAKGTAMVSVKYGKMETSIEVEVTKDNVADCEIKLKADSLTYVSNGVSKKLAFDFIDKFTGEDAKIDEAYVKIDDKRVDTIKVDKENRVIYANSAIKDQTSARLVVKSNGVTFETDFEVVVVKADKATGIELVGTKTLDIANNKDNYQTTKFTVYQIDEEGNRVKKITDEVGTTIEFDGKTVDANKAEFKAIEHERGYYDVVATSKIGKETVTSTITIQVINSDMEKASLTENAVTIHKGDVFDLNTAFSAGYDKEDGTIKEVVYGKVEGATTSGSALTVTSDSKVTVYVKYIVVTVNGVDRVIDVYDEKSYDVTAK